MAESVKTKTMIASALIELCEKKDYAKISIQEIATRCDINRQTFYYHFSDKKALLGWVYHNDSLKYLTSKDVSLDNWEEQVLKMLKQMQQISSFYATTLQGDRSILMDEFFQIVQNMFHQLLLQVDEEQVLSEKDLQFYTRFFSFGCSGILETWIKEGFQESPMEIAMELFRLAQDIEAFSYRLYQKNGEVTK